MSMVGYILGLGDRHPSNIMLERHTGKIVHIDFGDCFEIAMRREKFPEKIPFRLTRMLIKAMEVSGIEGNFRTTCEKTKRAYLPLWKLSCTIPWSALDFWILKCSKNTKKMEKATIRKKNLTQLKLWPNHQKTTLIQLKSLLWLMRIKTKNSVDR